MKNRTSDDARLRRREAISRPLGEEEVGDEEKERGDELWAPEIQIAPES